MGAIRVSMNSKRIFDLFLLLLVCPVAFPLLLCCALAVRLSLGSPVLFGQERPGLQGKLFTLYKFRSMRPVRANEDMVGTDAQRLTPLGRFLRKTSLDELPSLYNILRGDLSWVGPRPLLPQYLALYNTRQALRHSVPPGLTGWAQVHGRNALAWPKRLEMDAWYAEHRSLALDCRILWKTLAVVFSGQGVNAAQQATVKEFRGES